MQMNRAVAVTLFALAQVFGKATAAEIVVAHVAPLKGLEAGQGRAYGAGLQLYFDSVNRAGGINGNSITLVSEDDGGRAADTVALVKKFAADSRVVALTGVIGNGNVGELIASGVLQGAGIPLIGYRCGEIVPEAALVYNVRASLNDEITKIIQHVTTIGIRRLGLFYEEGAGGTELVAAAEKIAERFGATVASRASYAPGTAKVDRAVELFLKTQPQAIVVVSSGAATAAFIEQYRASSGAAQLFATSAADIEQLGKRLSDEQMQSVAIAQVIPSPYSIGTRLAKEYLDLTAKSRDPASPVSYSMFEGYIAGKVIVQALRQARAPSRSGVVAAMNSMAHFDLGGYIVSYSGSSRSGSRRVDLSIVSAGRKIRQ